VLNNFDMKREGYSSDYSYYSHYRSNDRQEVARRG